MQTNYTKLVETYALKKFRKARKSFDIPPPVPSPHLLINSIFAARRELEFFFFREFRALETRLTNSVT